MRELSNDFARFGSSFIMVERVVWDLFSRGFAGIAELPLISSEMDDAERCK
jgi:hypothetical protein